MLPHLLSTPSSVPAPRRRRSRLWQATAALTASVALMGVASSAAQAAEAPAGFQMYSADSIWNQPLRDDAPLSANNAGYKSWLLSTIASKKTWLNSTSCGMPMYWADADTPTIKVNLNHGYMDPGMIAAWSAVPMPADAAPATCSDKNFAVAQTQPDGTVTMWEFWSATKAVDGTWTARWGSVTQKVESDSGVASRYSWRNPFITSATKFEARTSNRLWGVTASSVEMMAGVITNEDMARGEIDHAVALALPDAAAKKWMWPAQRTDGSLTTANALPEGARLRLDPSVDLSKIQMTPMIRMIAVAAQKYGIVVRDRTHDRTVFYTEQPHAGQANPVGPLLAGKSTDAALAQFPWSTVQVLDAPVCSSSTATCLNTFKGVIDVDTDEPTVGRPVSLDTANSTLDQPRTKVEWDLDGDGTYEYAAGKAVALTYTPTKSGMTTLGVRMTTRDGVVTTASKTIDVIAPVQLTLAPIALSTKYFYAYSSQFPGLASVSQQVADGAVPTNYRKLYTSSVSGRVDVSFADTDLRYLNDASVRLYVTCGVRCLDLSLVNGAGKTLTTTRAASNSSGWMTLRVPAGTGAADIEGLTLRAAAFSIPNAGSTQAGISAVSLSVTGSR